MIKKLFTALTLLVVFASVSSAQWTNVGAFPNEETMAGIHGVAVDPDGKVWVTQYYKRVPWVTPTGDTIMTSGIRVYNPDGTEVDFSPVTTAITGGGFVVDTLHGNNRGLSTDENGNIVYIQSGPSKAIKFDYKTGEGIVRALVPEQGSSPTKAAVSDDGTVFIGPVVGGGTTAIAMYDTDLNYIGNAVVGPPAISRTMEVSADGNTIYWTPFTANKMYIFTRADEFSDFELTDSTVQGMSIESCGWNPGDGLLYISQDVRGTDTETWAPLSWYSFDPATYATQFAFSYEGYEASAPDMFPRGHDFTSDGTVAYFGTFAESSVMLQKAVKGEVPPVSITFICDMTYQEGVNTASIAGSFNGWDTGANPLTGPDGENKWSATIEGFTPGETIKFKFVKNGDGWESVPDREYTVPNENSSYEAFFDDFTPGTVIPVTFLANMEYEIVSTRFNPATDVVSARGSFNGWSSDDAMAPSLSDPNIYEVTVDMDITPGTTIYYKYAYDTPAGTNWEGASDRTYEFTQADIDAGFVVIERYFNDLTAEEITGQPATIKFVVDMNGAINAITGTAFTSIESVALAGATPPLRWPGGGWPDTDANLVFFMKDDGTQGDETAGDNNWTYELTFPQYSPITIEYKYGANWGNAALNGGANDNENGVGDNHFLSIPTYLNYGIVRNTFGVMGDHELATGVKEFGSGIPTEYSLEQNYPNPFNPSTVIRFSLPKSDLVTLKIYNMLGQEVATLLNEFKSAGSYEVTFDASNLSTGVYVYSVSSGQFMATKKMMLVK